jgi:hypothetical protein
MSICFLFSPCPDINAPPLFFTLLIYDPLPVPVTVLAKDLVVTVRWFSIAPGEVEH